MFISRSNLLGSSGKRHEYILRYPLVAEGVIRGESLTDEALIPKEVGWRTAAHIISVQRDYSTTHKRFTAAGPALEQLGNSGKGIRWNTDKEVELLRQLNHVKSNKLAKG